jgi:hypothetical protein
MFYYYEQPARIRYYGEIPSKVWIETDSRNVDRLYASTQSTAAYPKKWKEPPHVFLANLLSDEAGWPDLKALGKFTRIYGILSGYQHNDRYTIDIGKIWSMQTLLRQAWRGELQGLDGIEMDGLAHETEISFTRNGAELRASDLWTMIRMLFLRDYAAGRAQICAIQNCPRTPYFLQARSGQQFCSHPCAVLSNVRRFRKLQGIERKSHSEKPKGSQKP